MQIKQFRYYNDNLAYLVHGKTDAIAIDGGSVNDILGYLSKNGLTLKYVFNTHNHGDHTPGNQRLLNATNARFISCKDLAASKELTFETTSINIYETPGHTLDSICFHINDYLITGDTLFNGTVGNCFTGDETSFVNSLKKLSALGEQTIIYPGHDYVQPAMKFAKNHEIESSRIQAFLESYNPKHVFSTLSQEKGHNPFLRLDRPEIQKMLINNDLPVKTETELFQSLKKIEIWD
ncbi:hydroxyacylglutathione hydrolase [Candidatus Magnetomorum sp. HK-1]|nr:hydroxyacylglutathione hydrolase [Candidatus Magnetomorum sp. HK-1]